MLVEEPKRQKTKAISSDSSLSETIVDENDQEFFSLKSKKYIITKKEVYNSVLHYLENLDCNDEDFERLIKIINDQQDDNSQEIIEIDDNVFHTILNTYEKNGNRYCDFFYPDIKKFLDENRIKEIESNLLSKDANIFDTFEENRHKGENNSYICKLIRQDSVVDFIKHVNKTNIDLKSKTIPSIFETNPFLNDKNPTLIEYAAFFGSIQIFRYLMTN